MRACFPRACVCVSERERGGGEREIETERQREGCEGGRERKEKRQGRKNTDRERVPSKANILHHSLYYGKASE